MPFLKDWQSLLVGVLFGVLALAFTGFELWVQLKEIARTGGPDYMTPVMGALVWLCIFLLIAIAIFLNVRGAVQARSLRVENAEMRKQLEVAAERQQPPAELPSPNPQRTLSPAWSSVFKIQSLRADCPSTSEEIHFKNKLRVNLQNITGEVIYVWAPRWESSVVQPQDDPPGSRVLVEKSKGSWNASLSQGQWVTQNKADGTSSNCEFCYIRLKPDFTFNCYVGLAPRPSENVDGLLKRHGTIGTIKFPVRIDEAIHEVRVPAKEI
ncbi:MAG TPA: hypothetical protein VIY49_09380 [Bryobacteraceae bacterium]